MYTSISLPSKDEIVQDNDGFVTHNKTFIKNIPARRKDTSRNDELMAHQLGYSVSCIFEIDSACYNRQGYLIDESDETTYDIKRTHKKEKSTKIELTCEVRQSGKI